MKRTKKLCCLLMALAMALCLLPAGAFPAAAAEGTGGKPLKILSIGNSYSQDAMEYLYRVFAAEGNSNVVLGYLFKGGCTLEEHMEFAQNDTKAYTYYKNSGDIWVPTSNSTLLAGLTDEDWDVITLQTSPPRSGRPETFAEPFAYLIPYINAHKTNPEARLGWHMTWSYASDYVSDYYAYYQYDYMNMYQCIVNATQQEIVSRDAFSLVIPTGTTVENIRSSYIGDNLHRDGVHLTDSARLAAAYTWYCVLTGKTIETMKFTKTYGKVVDPDTVLVLTEAVNNAIQTPYAVTTSSYQVKPETQSGSYIEIRNTGTMADVPTIAPGSGLHVGLGRADITPSRPAPLAGYGNTRDRMGSETLTPEDRLTATCIAMTDGMSVNLLITQELIRTPTAWSHKVSAAIEAATGVPADHVTISAVHTHSAPDVGDEESADQPAKELVSENPTGTQETWYFEEWQDKLVHAAIDALVDLAPVRETKTAMMIVPGMTFVRHWRLASGTMGGVNTNSVVSGDSYKGEQRAADQSLRIIRFVRDDRKDVVLINWATHGTVASTSGTEYGTAGRPYISGDYSGYMRRYMETKDDGILVAFFLGPCGNANPRSSMKSVREKWKTPEEADAYGAKLGDYAFEAMQNMTVVETGKVQSLRQQHVAFDDGYVGTTRTIEQDVITIGGSIAFASAGYEMFVSNGEDVRDRSPFQMVFICTNSQGHEYMPDWQAHHYYLINGVGVQIAYEVRPSQCNVVCGTGEDLAGGLVAMMNKLYKTR